MRIMRESVSILSCYIGSVPVAHDPIGHNHSYWAVPRVISRVDQSESPIFNWSIGNVFDWAPLFSDWSIIAAMLRPYYTTGCGLGYGWGYST